MREITLYICIANLAIDFILILNFIQIIFAVFFGIQILSITTLLCGCIAYILDKYLNDLVYYYNDIIKQAIEELEE